MFSEFRLEVCIPIDYFNDFLRKLKGQPIGIIGNYIECKFWNEVQSSWIVNEDTNPFLGNPGEEFSTKEKKLSFKCLKKDVLDVVSHIKKIHPYEEIGLDIIPLVDLDYFKE